MVIQSDLSWLQKHERLILIFLTLLLFAFLGNKWMDVTAAKKEAQFEAVSNQVNLDKQVVAELAAQSQADTKKYQEMVDQLQKQNIALLSTIQSDNIALKQRQVADQALPLPDLAKRWETLVNKEGIMATPTGVNVTPEVSQVTVSQLEEVPILHDQLNKGAQLVENDEALLNQSQAVNLDLTKELKSDTLLLVDKDKQCQAEIAALKASDRKSKRNWFLRGMVTSGIIVTYIALHI